MLIRNFVAWIALAAVLAAALAVTLEDWSWQAAYEHAADCYAHHNAGNSNIDCPQPFWRWATHDPTAVFTFLLFVVTTVLAYFTYGLFVRATDSVADARKAAAKARSFVRSGGMRVPMRSNFFEIQARNAGDGTALIHRVE